MNDEAILQNEKMDMNLPKIPVPPLKTNGRVFLESLLNKNVKIEITDGRTLIGQYLCTDRDKNIVLGGCQEFVTDPASNTEEPRLLGLAMVPGRHVKSLHVDIDRDYHSALKSILAKPTND